MKELKNTISENIIRSDQISCSVMSDSLRPPWIAARQASLSITNSRSSLRLTSIESVMPSSHLILCRPFSSYPQSLPASESFPMSQLFARGGQSGPQKRAFQRTHLPAKFYHLRNHVGAGAGLGYCRNCHCLIFPDSTKPPLDSIPKLAPASLLVLMDLISCRFFFLQTSVCKWGDGIWGQTSASQPSETCLFYSTMKFINNIHYPLSYVIF